jgi:hypothetical protein
MGLKPVRILTVSDGRPLGPAIQYAASQGILKRTNPDTLRRLYLIS